MSRFRSCRIPALCALLLSLSVLQAVGQPIETGKLTFTERAAEVLRRLKLPPDPKFEAKVVRANELRNRCFEKAMRPLVSEGLRGLDLAKAACVACDKELVAVTKISFEANKHRYLDPDLNSFIETDRKSCSTYAFSLALKAPDQVMQRTSYGVFGAWEIEGQITGNGLLRYALLSRDPASEVTLELECRPVDKGMVSILRGPFGKVRGGKEAVYVTYSIDGDSLKQIQGIMYDEGVIVLPNDNSHAAGTMWIAASKIKNTIFLSAKSKAAHFSADGFSDAEREWLRRCVG